MSSSPIHDVVPARLRRQWVESGHYPDKDVYALFRERAIAEPERMAVVDDTESVRFNALDKAARKVARALLAAGVQPGEVVGVQLPNCWQACAVELGLAAAGAIALPYPVGRGLQDVAFLLGSSGAVAAVIWAEHGGEDYVATLGSIRSSLPALANIFVFESDGLSEGDDVHSLDAILADGSATADWSPPSTSPDGPVRILVTSGTEAAPKMVLYSHNALAGGRGNFIGELRGTCDPMRAFFMVPLGSAFGSSACSVALARHGATLILTRKFTAEGALAIIGRHRPTHLLGVPTMVEMILACPMIGASDVSSVEVVAMGGSALAKSTIAGARGAFGAAVVNVWGTGDGANCHTKLDDPCDKTERTVGQPNSAVADIRIVDDDDHEVPAGVEGEICALGPMSAMCYYNAPDLDDLYRISGGWVKTGDLGVFDPDGYLLFLARKKDIILRGGQNISPAATEAALQTHRDIVHAACIGMPDARVGERICAYLVLRPGSSEPSLEDLTQFLLVERGLSKSSLPERIEIIPEMPLNPGGKVLKRDLRARIAASLLTESGQDHDA